MAAAASSVSLITLIAIDRNEYPLADLQPLSFKA